MTGNKEISKMDGRECKYHAHFTSRAVIKRYRLIFEKNNNDSDNKQQSLINMQRWTRNLRTTTT